jgi:hypothetical protein
MVFDYTKMEPKNFIKKRKRNHLVILLVGRWLFRREEREAVIIVLLDCVSQKKTWSIRGYVQIQL